MSAKETKQKEERLKVGIVGLGYWGPNLLRNFVAHPGILVHALCDQDQNRLLKYGHGVSHHFTDFEALLNLEGLEAVAIATPVKTHFAMAKKALEAGLHVWVEKPLASTSVQALDLQELARKKERILFVDHTFVYNPAVQRAKEIIDSGILGDIYYYDSTRINLGLLQQDCNVIWDLAPHDIAILNYLLGTTPHSVTAIGASHNQHGLEDMAYVTFQYHEHVLAHLNFNWLSPLKVRRILIGGSKKMLVYDDCEPSEKIKVYDKGITVYGGKLDQDGIHKMLINYRVGEMVAPHIENAEALSKGVAHFVESIHAGKQPLSGGYEGALVLQMIEAIQLSLRNSGKMMKLRLTSPQEAEQLSAPVLEPLRL